MLAKVEKLQFLQRDLWLIVTSYIPPPIWKWTCSRKVQNMRSSNEWHLYARLPPLQCNLAHFELQLIWQDQGWGNRKGLFRVHLFRGRACLLDECWFEVADHVSRTDSLINPIKLLELAQIGDVLEFHYQVGDGGGHEIQIDFCQLTISAYRL